MAKDIATILRGLGLDPAMFQKFIHDAVVNNWSPDELKAQLYASPEFTAMFPGIFNPQTGGLIMTPGAYLQQRFQYQQDAARYGFTINSQDFANLVQHDVDVTEFNDRLEAAQRIQESPQFARAWKAVNGGDTKDVFDAVLGLKPAQFYKKYEDVTVMASAKIAGFKLNAGQVKRIEGLTEGSGGGGTLTEGDVKQSFEELARSLRDIPFSRLYGLGLTKNDLITLEFGGKNRDAIAKRAATVQAQMKREQEGARAHTQVYPGAEGSRTVVGGYGGRAQSQ